MKIYIFKSYNIDPKDISKANNSILSLQINIEKYNTSLEKSEHNLKKIESFENDLEIIKTKFTDYYETFHGMVNNIKAIELELKKMDSFEKDLNICKTTIVIIF